jgi:dethiobiotin synthetase
VSVLIVTGTGTGVGKTVVTAALAACAAGRVAVVKPAQTGVAAGEAGDLAEVSRLSGCVDVHEYARYPAPLSPHHAANSSGLPEVDLGSVARRVAELDSTHDHVLVEGAGGLLVPFDSAGGTIADLARELNAPALLVTSPGLGTINHTALTVRHMAQIAGIELAGMVIGSWPAGPGPAERYNLADLARLAGGELAGALPAGSATATGFGSRARAGLAPAYGGTFDWPAFQAAHRPRGATG